MCARVSRSSKSALHFRLKFFSCFFEERDLILSWNLTAALKGEYLNFKNFQFLPKIFFFEFLKVGSYLILSMRHLIGPLESVNRIFAHQKCFKTVLVFTKSRLLHTH